MSPGDGVSPRKAKVSEVLFLVVMCFIYVIF